VLGAPSSAARALKAAQLLERGFNTNSGPSWLMAPFGTVESVQPIAAAPPNLRDEMCGGHRKRPASEDEDDLAVDSNNPETPYAVFLASLRPGKAKGAAPLEVKMGAPVLVYTGTKPPAPGAQAATDSKPEKKPEKKKAAAVKPTAKDKDDASATSAAASHAAPKPKPKKPAPKPPPMIVTPAAEQSSQAK